MEVAIPQHVPGEFVTIAILTRMSYLRDTGKPSRTVAQACSQPRERVLTDLCCSFRLSSIPMTVDRSIAVCIWK